MGKSIIFLFFFSLLFCTQHYAQSLSYFQRLLESDTEVDLSDSRFGQSVDIDGQTLVVSSTFGRSKLNIFEKDNASKTWVKVHEITEQIPIDASIGFRLRIKDQRIAVTVNSSVHIYERDFGGLNHWGLVKKLYPLDPTADVRFGVSIDMSEDLITVGTSFEPGEGDSLGSMYIFSKGEGGSNNWGLSHRIIAPIRLSASGNPSDLSFGQSVGISDNFVLVGSTKSTGHISSTGIVFIYEKDNGGLNQWGLFKKIETSSKKDVFGYEIKLDGDIALVGALNDHEFGNISTGTIHVYSKNYGGPNNWGFVQKVSPSNGTSFNYFGQGFDISGDRLIAFDHPGEIYFYERSIITDQYEEVFQFSIIPIGNFFGFPANKLALSDDTAVIGSYLASDLGVESGCVHIFETCAPAYDGLSQLSGIISTTTNYQTESSISSDQQLHYLVDDQNIQYRAPEYVELLPNFEVKIGLTFQAEIDDCVTNE